MQSIEIATSPDKEKPGSPEVIFDKRVEDFINGADDYATLYTKLEHAESDPDKKAYYREQSKKYDSVVGVIYDSTRGDDTWTLNSLKSSINDKKVKTEQELEKFPNSKMLAEQLKTIKLTIAHIDGYTPIKGVRDMDLMRVRADRVFKGENTFKYFKKNIENGETYPVDDAKKEIDKIYRLLGETELANNLELKYDTLNKKLEQVQAMGQDAVRQYVIDLIGHYDKHKGEELTVEDISTLRLAFVTFKDGTEIRKRPIVRPVFIIEDDEQRQRITGDEINGFMSTDGFKHLLPESGLDDLPIIVSRNNLYTVKHEIVHSMDIKCIRGDRQQNYDSVLSEAIANFASKDFRSDGGWIVGHAQKIYFDKYSKEAKEKISFEDFNQIVNDVESSIYKLEALGFDKQTVLKTMMICGTVQDFLKISGAITAAAEVAESA